MIAERGPSEDLRKGTWGSRIERSGFQALMDAMPAMRERHSNEKRIPISMDQVGRIETRVHRVWFLFLEVGEVVGACPAHMRLHGQMGHSLKVGDVPVKYFSSVCNCETEEKTSIDFSSKYRSPPGSGSYHAVVAVNTRPKASHDVAAIPSSDLLQLIPSLS